jgi:Stress responsive A/B Barrel Domain
MFIHSVYFKLRDDLTSIERRRFDEGIRSLAAIESVERGYIGVPAGTDRPIIDRDYTHALILAFADQRAHDDYQVHPVHDRFREQCAGYWSGIRIFDTITNS